MLGSEGRMLSLTFAAGDAGAAVALGLAVAIPRVAVPRPPVRAPLQLRRQELIVVMNGAQRRIVGAVAARASRDVDRGVEREREDAEQREKDGEQTIYERFRDTALEFLGLQKKENLNDFSLHQLQFR